MDKLGLEKFGLVPPLSQTFSPNARAQFLRILLHPPNKQHRNVSFNKEQEDELTCVNQESNRIPGLSLEPNDRVSEAPN